MLFCVDCLSESTKVCWSFALHLLYRLNTDCLDIPICKILSCCSTITISISLKLILNGKHQQQTGKECCPVNSLIWLEKFSHQSKIHTYLPSISGKMLRQIHRPHLYPSQALLSHVLNNKRTKCLLKCMMQPFRTFYWWHSFWWDKDQLIRHRKWP